MKNEIQSFTFEHKDVRTLMIDDEPYFVGIDVASVLGYSNARKALQDHVDDEDKKLLTSRNVTLENMPNRGLIAINKSGLYSLILSSKMPNAKKFRRWVTSEVLPSIDQKGFFLNGVSAERKIQLLLEATAENAEERKKLRKDVDQHTKEIAQNTKEIGQNTKDIIDLKENTEITSSQVQVLWDLRKKHIVKICGGKDSEYYRSTKARKVFSSFGRAFKDYFMVARYDALPKKKFDEAVDFTKSWYPDFLMKQEIDQANAQTNLFEDEGE